MELRVPIHAAPRLPGRLDRPSTPDAVADRPPDVAGRHVVLCGGEPTLRPDLPALVTAFRAARPASLGLETDGLALSAPGVPVALSAAGLDFVRVPFPSARKDAHDWLAGEPGVAARRTRGLRAARAAGLAIEAEITLTRPTTDHLAETVELLAALGVRRVVVRRLRVAGRVDADAYLSLGPRLAAARIAIDDARRHGLDLVVDGFDDLDDHVAVLDHDAPFPPPVPSPDGVMRLGWTRDEPTREVRRRLVRAVQTGGRFRLAGPDLFEHPGALELLRDAARLGFEAVERAPGATVPAWSEAQRRRLPPIEDATLREAMLERERIAGRGKHWVRLVTACNSRCLFCLDSDTPRNLHLPDDDIRADLRLGRERGADKVILSGGEGSLHPRFIEYVAYARSIGYERVQTVTNGWRWADKDFFEAAMDAGIGEITFSLHGHTAELHEHLTQHPGSFDRIVKAILRAVRARDRGLITNIDVVINAQNVGVIDKIVEFAIRLGVTEFDLLHVIPQASAFEHRDALFYDPSDHLEVLHKVFRLNRHPGFVVWTNRFPVAWLEGLEDLIQDPHKMLDEVNGRRFQLRAYLDRGTPLSCREPDRCVHCFIEPFCTATDRVAARTRDAEWDVFDVGDGPAPDVLPFGARYLGTRRRRDTELPQYVRGAPAQPLPTGDDLYVAETAEQVDAWLPTDRPLDVELNRDTAAALLRRRADVAASLDHLRIHQPGRATLAEAVADDVRDPATFFAALALPVAVSGLPPCATPGAVTVAPRAVLGRDAFDPDTGRFATAALAQRHVENTYFARSMRCRDCAVAASCEGFPIQMIRDQGLRLARPLDVASPLPPVRPRLADGVAPVAGPTPGLPGFAPPEPVPDPLRRLSKDRDAARRRRRLEVLG